MIGIAGLVVAAAIGVDFGWQQTPDGDLEYIIQISPEQLEALKEGEDISSFLPPEAEKVTCFRVQVGIGNLPHETVLTPNGPIEAIPAAGYEDSRAPALRRPGQMSVSDRADGQWNGGNTGNQNNFYQPTQPHAQPHTGVDPYQYTRPNTGINQPRDPNLDRHASVQNNHVAPGFSSNNGTSAFRTTPTTTQPNSTTLPTMQPVNRNNMQPQEQPWLPLLLTGTALFLSLGGNAYLGWIAAEFYTRYRDTVERMRAERRY